MLNEGAAIESCVETIARTLPICKVRKVAYATFSILQIFHSGQAYLAELTILPVCSSGMEKSWIIPMRSGRSKGRRYMNAASG